MLEPCWKAELHIVCRAKQYIEIHLTSFAGFPVKQQQELHLCACRRWTGCLLSRRNLTVNDGALQTRYFVSVTKQKWTQCAGHVNSSSQCYPFTARWNLMHNIHKRAHIKAVWSQMKKKLHLLSFEGFPCRGVMKKILWSPPKCLYEGNTTSDEQHHVYITCYTFWFFISENLSQKQCLTETKCTPWFNSL